MKNHVKHFAIIAFAAVIGLGFSSCEVILGDFAPQKKIFIPDVDGQYYGRYGKIVLLSGTTEKASASGIISGSHSDAFIYFSLLDSEIGGAFTESGFYSVVFGIYDNSYANDCIWEGTLSKSITSETTTIEFDDFKEQSITYVITGSGSSFSATKSGTTVSGATSRPIQTVIDAIRTNAAGAAVTIRFGSTTSNTLNIGSGKVEFNNSGGTWGSVTISGKITGTTSPVVTFGTGVSGRSSADITQNSGGGTALQKSGTGTLTITGGTIAGGTDANMLSSGIGIYVEGSTATNIQGGTISGGTAVKINGSTATVSGGSISSSNGIAIAIAQSTDTVTISGGTIRGTGPSGTAITTYGRITLRDNPTITSQNTDTGTIYILGGHSTGNTLTIASTVTLTNTAGGKRVYIAPNLNPSATCGGTGWSNQLLE